MRYLGLILDSRWRFEAHFAYLAPKLLKVASALGGLLPNIGGPSVACRRLYLGVVRSMALYGAPVWAEALTRRSITILRRSQRVLAVRVIRGYRTIGHEAACVLAGSTPWDLEARTLASLFQWREEAHQRGDRPAPREVEGRRQELRQVSLASWAQRLETAEYGVTAISAVLPVLVEWVKRQHGCLTFHLTQILSGHGCFGRYLWRVARREPDARCHHCDSSEDTARHTLEECPAWERQREALKDAVGDDLSLPTVVEAMVADEEGWRAMTHYCESVMAAKEVAEREREATADNPARARRTGGRRRRRNDLMPP